MEEKLQITRTPNADSRTADSAMSLQELKKSTDEHICHVRLACATFADMMLKAGTMHDWTKIRYMTEFHDDMTSVMNGDTDKNFKDLKWYSERHLQERHHLNDHCPDDVTLIDVLERVCDICMAGMSRSGKVYDDDIDPEILMKAYKNTVELLKEKIEVVG